MTQHKTCTKCGQSKPTTEFSPCNGGGKYGVRSNCKECRRALLVAAEARRIECEKETARQEAAARAAAKLDTAKALPRTFNTIKDPTPWVPVDRTYYRNGGNKHIQSRGF